MFRCLPCLLMGFLVLNSVSIAYALEMESNQSAQPLTTQLKIEQLFLEAHRGRPPVKRRAGGGTR